MLGRKSSLMDWGHISFLMEERKGRVATWEDQVFYQLKEHYFWPLTESYSRAHHVIHLVSPVAGSYWRAHHTMHTSIHLVSEELRENNWKLQGFQKEKLHGWDCASQSKSSWNIFCCNFYNKLIAWKCLTLKWRSRPQSTPFAIYYSMANINLYKSHTWAFFASSYCFLDIHIKKIHDLKNIGRRHDIHNNRSGTIRWQIADFLSDGNHNFCIFQPILVKIATWKVWP